jgi:hypothetical protein
MWFGADGIVARRLREYLAEHTREPGPSFTGPARGVVE